MWIDATALLFFPSFNHWILWPWQCFSENLTSTLPVMQMTPSSTSSPTQLLAIDQLNLLKSNSKLIWLRFLFVEFHFDLFKSCLFFNIYVVCFAISLFFLAECPERPRLIKFLWNMHNSNAQVRINTSANEMLWEGPFQPANPRNDP